MATAHDLFTTPTTTAHVAHNVALSAAGWAGVTSLKSDHMRGIRIMAVEQSNGTCAACGEALAGEAINVCHIVATRGTGNGMAPHNVYVGHLACNDYDREVCEGDPFRVFASLARPDLVISNVPPRRVALAACAEADAIKARRFAIRNAVAGGA